MAKITVNFKPYQERLKELLSKKTPLQEVVQKLTIEGVDWNGCRTDKTRQNQVSLYAHRIGMGYKTLRRERVKQAKRVLNMTALSKQDAEAVLKSNMDLATRVRIANAILASQS